ncbi:ABC transporter permease [Catellatospora sp. TT07R-123]|uniref:ABC transporter permease n=1 Tax=Catellatospora sp. TT07R-123 TaxID=2733863 RepID=UPI001B2771D6|nr:ABC transporter permease [Catellatospora sp. TT07R-123]GHJ49514.1 ABC transporter permease [Catellatospora sp. TT07R-123]
MSGVGDGAGAATHRPRRTLSAGYVLRKLLSALAMLLFVTVVNFFLFRVLPGDPAKAFAPRGRNADPEALRELRDRLGLTDPWYTAFGKYLRALLQGDLGVSFSQHAKVVDVIGERILPTVLLSGTALVLAAGIGVWLGARSGWRHGSRFDRVASSLAVTFYSVPEWLLGLVLLVLLNKYGVFPARGMSDPRTTLPAVVDTLWHMVLPVTVLTVVYVAEYSLIMRSSMLDERRADYLATARAKGLRDDLVMRRHALPNALLPSMTLFFLSMGFVVAGAITVETVFSWPGLGLLTFDALRGPDIPLLQGLFLFFSAGVIVMNLVADLLMPVLDPRVRAS